MKVCTNQYSDEKTYKEKCAAGWKQCDPQNCVDRIDPVEPKKKQSPVRLVRLRMSGSQPEDHRFKSGTGYQFQNMDLPEDLAIGNGLGIHN